MKSQSPFVGPWLHSSGAFGMSSYLFVRGAEAEPHALVDSIASPMYRGSKAYLEKKHPAS